MGVVPPCVSHLRSNDRIFMQHYRSVVEHEASVFGERENFGEVRQTKGVKTVVFQITAQQPNKNYV